MPTKRAPLGIALPRCNPASGISRPISPQVIDREEARVDHCHNLSVSSQALCVWQSHGRLSSGNAPVLAGVC
jgi:hypothetical protein